jgi:hypothetical protein
VAVVVLSNRRRAPVAAVTDDGIQARRRQAADEGGTRMSAALSRRRLAVVLALAAVALAPASLPPADAAAPSSGTVTDTSPAATWTAGPFVVPNVTGAAGDPVCTAPGSCDDYALHVATPAGYGSGHQLSISVGWPNTAADFDLYVLDAAGKVVGSSASSADPEQVLLPPTTGDYTVRVVPYLPLGQSFTGRAELTTPPVDPAPATFPAPGYTNYAAPESLADAHNAGEPSIGVDPTTGAVMYQAYLSTFRVGFGADGANWQDKSASAANGCPQGSTTSLDPILYTDRTTGRTFESQLAGKTALTCYTDDDGDTWTPTSGAGINSGVDHQTIGGGPFADNGVGALTAYPNAVYYCSQDIADALCASSHDGGLTYGPAVPIYDLTQCGGLHGHVQVDPVSGTVYVPNKGCGDGQAVAVSEDNGLHWTVRTVPGSTPGDSDPSVGIGANGTVYFGYQAADGHARTAVSHDHGQTWVDGQDVGAQLGVQNVVFPAMTAGDDDRAALTFLGTTTGGNYQDPAFPGVWHLYVATTIDGGRSWRTVDATPTDPVQRGSICTGGTTCGNDRNLLDFMGATVDPQGRVLVGYADGCTAACAQPGGAQNYDALATIARQTSGPRLFAASDPRPDLTVGPPQVAGKGKGTTLSAVVTNRGQAPAQGVTVRFSTGSSTLGTSGPVDLAAGESRTVSVASPTAIKKGTTVTAVVDPANTVPESDEGNNKSSATV